MGQKKQKKQQKTFKKRDTQKRRSGHEVHEVLRLEEGLWWQRFVKEIGIKARVMELWMAKVLSQ